MIADLPGGFMSMIGKTLGHYSVSTLIGRGGMGEVYKAKDQKLGRDVAIKVLPEEFAKDTDRVARFQREAKLLASLNHPNIAAIHGLEEFEGTHFLVLELVEGDTLADQIKKGPIPVEESLKLALQIAEALEAAHEKGVIHRDLKPANIKVTPEGKVKVLDFGLAKAYAREQEEMIQSDSPTLSVAATQQGVILGTAAYMSPEQAKGKSVDRRADIWAFGVVLFEMVTGRAAFSGQDVSEILAAVIRAEPDWNSLPTNLHWRLKEVMERCLEKEVRNRYSGISDARVDIHKVLADPPGALLKPAAAVEPQARLRLVLPWVAAALVLGLIIAGVAVWYLKPSEPRHVHRLDYTLPADQEFDRIRRQAVAVSPDGTKIVYVANGQLYLKNSSEPTARPIQGTSEDPANPFFSPDGQWIGYFDLPNKQLKKILIGGGSSVMLCKVNDPFGATWGSDDMIVFGDLGGIMRISAKGGTRETIVKGENNQNFYHPQILPGGKSILFTIPIRGTLSFQVAVQSLHSGDRKALFPGGPAQYVSTGHLVYAFENRLFAVPFDPDTLDVTDGQVPLIEGVFRLVAFTPTQSAISESGMLVYLPETAVLGARANSILVWVDHQGKEEPLGVDPKAYHGPRISPDGKKVAFAILDGDKREIWIWDVVQKEMRRLTFNEFSSGPLWTLDGKRIAFMSNNEGKSAVFWRAADGTGDDELLGSGPGQAIAPWAWSVDEKTLVTIILVGSYFNIGSLSMEGDHTYKPLLQEEFTELQPKISPDGRWMTYMSDEDGENEVYVRPFPNVDKGKWQISTDGGDSPLWSPDGRKLFYRKDNEVIAVSVETEPTFEYGKREVLFSGNYIGLLQDDSHTWDIHPDGKRFLMIKPAKGEGEESSSRRPRKLNIVLNWFEELKKNVPVE